MAPGCGPQLALALKATLKVTQLLAFLPRAHAVSVREGRSRKETDHVAPAVCDPRRDGGASRTCEFVGTCQQRWPWPTQETHTIPYTQRATACPVGFLGLHT